VVGTVKLEPINSANADDPVYTGLFQGANYGFVRLSESNFLATDATETQLFSPSVALKFLVTGEKSANLLTQVTFDGVEDGYFFENNFTNHPQRSSNECMRATVEKKMAEASKFSFSTGTGHLASVDEDGNPVEADAALFPYEVILVPNRDEFPKRDMNEGENMLDFFENWTPEVQANGTIVPVTLFTVKARHDPSLSNVSVENLPEIAEIQLTSELFRSTFGDERLFFQHETITRDFKKLRNQGDAGKAREKEWKKMIKGEGRKTGKDDEWGDNDILELPSDNGEAMDIIEAGMLGEP